MSIHPKLVGGLSGVGLGGAVATIAVWGLNAHGINPPEPVEQAFGTIFDFAVALLFGWYTPAGDAPKQ